MSDKCLKDRPGRGHDGRCCCNCRYHIEDFHHCTTVTDRKGCVCSSHKGWICLPPEEGMAYSGWSEHGVCEMHHFAANYFPETTA